MPAYPVEYDSSRRPPPALRELIDLYQYRDLLGLLIVNSIRSRYKRSSLGLIWTLLGPLLMMGVMTFAFSSVFSGEAQNYPIYVLAGLLLWNFFAQTTVSAMNQLVWGSTLLKRVYVPRTVFAVAAVGAGLVNFLLALLPLAGLMIVLGHPVRVAILFVPVALLVAAMFVLGASLFLSSLSVFFTDLIPLYQVILQAWFYLTPIVYPKTILPERFVWFMNLNPMHNLLELFRVPLYLGTLPGPNTLAAAIVSAVLALGLGWWIFAEKADEISFRI